MQLMLGKDYELASADSIATAREQLNQRIPDLVLLDMTLKGDEDGLDLVREMRKEPRYQDLAVIGLSGHDSTQYVADALDAGCQAYLTKPFTRQGLLDAIRSFLVA